MTRAELQELFDAANRRWAETNDDANMPFWDLIVALADVAGVGVPTEPGQEFQRLTQHDEIEW